MNANEEIQNQVRKYRMLSGFTQADLAQKIGVTRQTVLSIEKGKFTPSVTLALRLAKVFEVSVESLFQIVEDEE